MRFGAICMCCLIIFLSWSQWYIPFKNKKFWSSGTRRRIFRKSFWKFLNSWKDRRCVVGFSVSLLKCQDVLLLSNIAETCTVLTQLLLWLLLRGCQEGFYEDYELNNEMYESFCVDIDECKTTGNCGNYKHFIYGTRCAAHHTLCSARTKQLR